MPQFYRVLKADPLDGEFTPNRPNAKPLKSFWCQVEGVDAPVMMSKQVPNTPSLTEGHYGVLEPKVSGKGNQYFKFTSMQVPQGESRPRYAADTITDMGNPANVQAQRQTQHASDDSDIPLWFAPFGMMLREVYAYVKEQKGEEVITNPAPVSEETATEETKKDAVTMQELEDIFGAEVEPMEITDER